MIKQTNIKKYILFVNIFAYITVISFFILLNYLIGYVIVNFLNFHFIKLISIKLSSFDNFLYLFFHGNVIIFCLSLFYIIFIIGKQKTSSISQYINNQIDDMLKYQSIIEQSELKETLPQKTKSKGIKI